MQARIMRQEHRIDTPDGQLFACRWQPQSATGAPFVLFHDSLGCVELWRDFPERLAATTGREVIAYDRFGFGRSDVHPGNWSARFIQDEAEMVFPTLCAAFGIQTCVALGHSVGGTIAAACAALHPERCTALITLAAMTVAEPHTLEAVRLAREQFARPGQLERLQRYHADKARWVLSAWTETWLSADFAGWTLERHVAALDCPLLVIHGDADEYGSLRHPECLLGLGRQTAHRLILAGTGHFPHREAPAEILAAVQHFLACDEVQRAAAGA